MDNVYLSNNLKGVIIHGEFVEGSGDDFDIGSFSLKENECIELPGSCKITIKRIALDKTLREK